IRRCDATGGIILASRNQEAYMSTLVLVEAVTSLGPLRDGVIDRTFLIGGSDAENSEDERISG
ncbi:hypothetical protein, partial [Stecheria intestinalis]